MTCQPQALHNIKHINIYNGNGNGNIKKKNVISLKNVEHRTGTDAER